MINLSHEYKAQIILGSLQSLITLFGSLLVGIFLKIRGYDPAVHELSLRFSLIRNYGFLLILIPFAWVCFTIYCERSHSNRFTKRTTIITGIALLAVICFYCLVSVIQAIIAARIIPN
jgi:hypothetical protein